MKKVMQQFEHTDAYMGDCFRACIASLTEISINDIPYSEKSEDWLEKFDQIAEVLEKFGWAMRSVYVESIPEDSLSSPDTDNILIAIGKSPRSTNYRRINHAVLWKNGLVHDPHKSGASVQDIIIFTILYKI